MFRGFQLHLIREGPLAGQDILPLNVTVNHNDDCGIVVQLPHNYRHGFQARQFTPSFSAMPGNQLIPALRTRARYGWHQHTIFPDAVCRISHAVIVQHLERMVGERMQLFQRDFLHLFPLGIVPAGLCTEQII